MTVQLFQYFWNLICIHKWTDSLSVENYLIYQALTLILFRYFFFFFFFFYIILICTDNIKILAPSIVVVSGVSIVCGQRSNHYNLFFPYPTFLYYFLYNFFVQTWINSKRSDCHKSKKIKQRRRKKYILNDWRIKI